jgi:hypothetical protein
MNKIFIVLRNITAVLTALACLSGCFDGGELNTLGFVIGAASTQERGKGKPS